MNYVTIEDSTAETVISRSRFIAFAYGVDSEEEVLEKLRALRKTYHDSTHVCYAAIWDELGVMSRFSDDGEPSGTAGAPILDAIKSAGVKKCLVAVVRYFGGVKLGTGGLTRAYSSVAAESLGKAKKVNYTLCDEYRCTVDFATFGRLGGKGISDVCYASDVTFTYSCPEGEDISPLIDRANGKIKIEKGASRYKKMTYNA